MPRRHVDWNMGKMYGRGWLRGIAEAEADCREQHQRKMTYPRLCRFIIEKGRVSLRNNTYPIVSLPLSLVSDDVYLIRPIGEKIDWSFIKAWSHSSAILLVWQGDNAQVLLRKILQYIPESGMRQLALKALRWAPKGGTSEVEPMDDPEGVSGW